MSGLFNGSAGIHSRVGPAICYPALNHAQLSIINCQLEMLRLHRAGGTMREPFGRTRGAAVLRPGYLAALAGMLVLVLAVFAVYEIRTSRQIVLASMQRGAVSLVEAVARGGKTP